MNYVKREIKTENQVNKEFSTRMNTANNQSSMVPQAGACETTFGSSVETAIEIDVTSTTKVLERTFMFATLFYIIYLINNKK